MKRRVVAAAVSAIVACLVFALCGCTEPYNPDADMKEPTIDASALKEAGVLHVGVDASSYPFAGQASSRMSGLDVDLSAAIAQEMGLKVDFVDVGSDGVAALGGDEVDMVMHIEASTASGNCWTSDAYAPSVIALFSTDEAAGVPAKSDNPVIAAQTGSVSEYLITRQYGDEALHAEDDMKTAFEELANGAVQYVAADAVAGTYVSNSMGAGAHIVGMMQQPDNYCIGIASDNTELQLGVTQAISELQTKGMYEIIMLKWLGGQIDVSQMALTDSAKSEPKKVADEESNEADKAIAANAGTSANGTVGANAVSTDK